LAQSFPIIIFLALLLRGQWEAAKWQTWLITSQLKIMEGVGAGHHPELIVGRLKAHAAPALTLLRNCLWQTHDSLTGGWHNHHHRGNAADHTSHAACT
jgi:hypothetical protein